MKHDLNDIRLFATVVSKGTFTAAAKSQGLQVSAVSRRIARLEADLQTRLLHRTTRKLSLTDAGRTFHQTVVPGLDQLQAATAAVQELRVEPSGRIRFTTVNGMSAFAWNLVRDFIANHPKISIELELSEQIVDLVAGEFDVALRTGNLADSSLVSRRVAEVQLALYASPEYTDAYGAPHDPDELAKHECIIVGATGSTTSWTLSSGRKQRRVDVAGRLTTTSMETARHACVSGFGIGHLPTPICDELVEAGRLVRILPDWRGPTAGLYVVFPSKQHISPSVRAFIDHLTEHASAAITASAAHSLALP